MHFFLKITFLGFLLGTLEARSEDGQSLASVPFCQCTANGGGFQFGSLCNGAGYSGVVSNDTISCAGAASPGPCTISGSVTIGLTACDGCFNGIVTSADNTPGNTCSNASAGTTTIGSQTAGTTIAPTRNAVCDANCGWRIQIRWWGPASCTGTLNEAWNKSFLCKI